MKKIKEMILFLIPIIFLTVIFNFFLETKLVLSISFTSTLIVLYMIYKEEIGQELVIAFLIAVGWTSYYYYDYTSANFMFGDINLFPLVSFTFGLVVLREVYEKLKIPNKLFLVSIIYLFSLALVEYLGYYLFGIKLDSNYPSIFNIGILHGPIILKLFYLSVGPIYLLITDYLKVK